MNRHFPLALAFAIIISTTSGCVAIGTGHCGSMSIADEIQELKEARDGGHLTHEEFHIGMAALHNRMQ